MTQSRLRISDHFWLLICNKMRKIGAIIEFFINLKLEECPLFWDCVHSGFFGIEMFLSFYGIMVIVNGNNYRKKFFLDKVKS